MSFRDSIEYKRLGPASNLNDVVHAFIDYNKTKRRRTMEVAIIGFGYVGKRVAEMLSGKMRFVGYDKYKISWPDSFKNCEITAIFDRVLRSDIVYVCVPTPASSDGSCDISAVDEVLSKLSKDQLIILKSTVPPGTTDRLRLKYGLRLVFSPEYVGESKYWSPFSFETNMADGPFVILGGLREHTQEALDFLVRLGGPYKKYFQTDAKTAELVKYWMNSFYATKVTFCNEMYEICKALGVDFYEARDLWLNDPRVARGHTMVFNDNRGYSGKCFPKDIAALISASRDAGYDPKLLKQVVESNDSFRVGTS